MRRLVQAAAGRLCRLCRQGSNHLGRLDANVLIQLRVRQGQLHRLLNLLDLQGGQEKTTDGAMQAMVVGLELDHPQHPLQRAWRARAAALEPAVCLSGAALMQARKSDSVCAHLLLQAAHIPLGGRNPLLSQPTEFMLAKSIPPAAPGRPHPHSSRWAHAPPSSRSPLGRPRRTGCPPRGCPAEWVPKLS